MDPILASSLTSLFKELSALEAKVHKKRSERSNEACELWVLQRALPLIFPGDQIGEITLQKSERPDFILDIGGKRIGIEITELIDKNVAHASSKVDELQSAPDIYTLGKFHSGASVPPNSKDFLSSIDFARSEGFVGDAPEEYAAALCRAGLQTKEHKAENYLHCSELLVVGYLSQPAAPLDMDDLERLATAECSTVNLRKIDKFYVYYNEQVFQAA